MGQDGTLCKLYYGANQVCMISSITVIAAMSLDRMVFHSREDYFSMFSSENNSEQTLCNKVQ